MFGKVKRWFIRWIDKELRSLAWQSSKQIALDMPVIHQCQQRERHSYPNTDRIVLWNIMRTENNIPAVPPPAQHLPGHTTNVLRQYGHTYDERPLQLYKRAKRDGKL